MRAPVNIIGLVLLGLVAGIVGTALRTKEDDEASALAVKRAQEECGKVDLSGVDRDAARKSLLGAIGDKNIILNALKKANGTDELGTKLGEEVDAMWMMQTAGALVMAFIMNILWFFCCWSACPCCKCCRCGAKERHTPAPIKIGVLACLAGVSAGMLISSFTAFGGASDVERGFNSMSCPAARLLNSTLNGNADDQFLGMLPLLDRFDQIKGTLADGSSFISELYAILDKTGEITGATVVAGQSTLLLSNVLKLPANVNPQAANAAWRPLHKCMACNALAEPLALMSKQMNEGVGSALAAARGEVHTQMNSENRAALRQTFDGSMKPLRDAATAVRDGTQIFIKDDFITMKENALQLLGLGILVVVLMVFPVISCAGISGGSCTYKEYNQANADHGVNPWNKITAPCACSAWCCGWIYAELAFMLGGFLIVYNVVMSSMCLVMDDISSQMLQDILPAIGGVGDPAQLTMMSEMIDSCFARDSLLGMNSSTKSLTDIISIVENGTSMSIREKVQAQMSDQISSQFSSIGTSSGATLMGTPQISQVLNLLATMPVDAMMITQPEMQKNSVYNGMGLDPRGEAAGVQIGFGSTLSCTDYTPEGQQKVYGVTELVSRMQGFTSSGAILTSPSTTCTRKVSCNAVQNVASGNACEATNNLMDLKAELMNLNTYRCDIFEKADGTDCDILGMSQKLNGEWQNDCLQFNAAGQAFMVAKEKTCTLAEFAQYFADWSTRLTVAITRLDTAAVAVQKHIAEDMQALLQKDILKPVSDMMDNAKCTFLKEQYRVMITGFCYIGAVGFRTVAKSFVANASLSVVLVVLCYAIWRRAVDNRNDWNKAIQRVGAPVHAKLNVDSVHGADPREPTVGVRMDSVVPVPDNDDEKPPPLEAQEAWH